MQTAIPAGLKPLLGHKHVPGDFWGALAAMLVALPASIAFGVTIYAAVAPSYAAIGALAGIIGASRDRPRRLDARRYRPSHQRTLRACGGCAFGIRDRTDEPGRGTRGHRAAADPARRTGRDRAIAARLHRHRPPDQVHPVSCRQRLSLRRRVDHHRQPDSKIRRRGRRNRLVDGIDVPLGLGLAEPGHRHGDRAGRHHRTETDENGTRHHPRRRRRTTDLHRSGDSGPDALGGNRQSSGHRCAGRLDGGLFRLDYRALA